ncbi:ABC transporter ATP-binding protein [Methylibium petroleiphilum]|uniref:ABC transporter ATP-binding protein n=1 Tax=Methylibium petroleiphilum TaxID=105560 RepID=UPI0023568F5A|nr:ABC transporter ATP-binding protein [Methylibium petroleiphilum]
MHDYGTQRALHGLTCGIERGSVTALVGPNGAGKTTLMRCIAGLEVPLSGQITVAGIDVIAQPRESHRQLGFLADSFGVSTALSVRQTLSYAALAHGAAPEAAAAAVPPVARRLGLTDLLDRLCGALSRGQRQRVAIGQALIHRPQLLILDEPASGLDPEARAGLAALFRSLREEGMTLLVSSHILAELDEYSTHMLMLRDGRVVEHRALTVAAPAAGDRPPRRLRAGLLTAAREAQAWLGREAGLQATLVDAHTLELAFGGTDADQAALLARLIGAGFTVSSFAEQRENLQQSYLRSVAGAGAGA